MIDSVEIAYLAQVLHHLHKASERLSIEIEAQDRNYKDIQKYMVDAKSELDKYEQHDVQQTLSMIDKGGYALAVERDRVRKLIESPFFGRFDFAYVGK